MESSPSPESVAAAAVRGATRSAVGTREAPLLCLVSHYNSAWGTVHRRRSGVLDSELTGDQDAQRALEEGRMDQERNAVPWRRFVVQAMVAGVILAVVVITLETVTGTEFKPGVVAIGVGAAIAVFVIGRCNRRGGS